MRNLRSLLFLALALGLLAGPAHAQSAILLADYVGYGWEDGGFPPSDSGDILEMVGIAGYVDPITGVDLGTSEVTFHISGLVSTGEVALGGGLIQIAYTGGTLRLFADDSPDADYGTNPANATSPSTFENGTMLFEGSFTNFTLIINGSGVGGYEGTLDPSGGTLVSEVCADCAYTWGGAWTETQIPEGYDLQIDGALEIDPVVSAEESGWGSLKVRYDD